VIASSIPARVALCAASVAVIAAFWMPVAAQASFGFLPGSEGFDVKIAEEGGVGAETRAGSHPYSITTSVNFELGPEAPGGPFTDGDLRNLDLELPSGLIENPSAVSQCSQERFHIARSSPFEESRSGESCQASTQIGIIEIRSSAEGGETRSFGLFNLVPPPGFPAQIGASPYGVPLVFTPRLRDAGGEYGITLQMRNFSQRINVSGFTLTIWGNPWGLSHNGQRGNCLNQLEPTFPWAKCAISPPQPDHEPFAYLTLPASCGTPLEFKVSASGWGEPAQAQASAPSRDAEGNPSGMIECAVLRFEPLTFGQPTNPRASSATGYDFSLTPKEEALTNYKLLVPSQPRKAVVSLPGGMTINPSVAAGLGVCTPPSYAAETATSPLGSGCPENSKIGSFTVRSPLFEDLIAGAVYLAQPDDRRTATPGAENPFDSLLALYLIAKAPARGVIVKVAGRLHADPGTGRLIGTFDRLPQLPYSNLKLHFREGQRAPLISPSACGSFSTQIDLTPWNDPSAVASTISSFQIEKGLGPGGSCPSGTPPFNPGASGGTLNGNSGAYTPFYLRLTRADDEQEIVSYSADLPKGLTGRLAGVAVCPDAVIEAAKLRTGKEEEADPSCPATSQIGRTFTGYGVGPVLAYAPGTMYLAGPYHGSPLSVVAVNSAAVGPFDLGTVVIRSAFRVDPHTAQLSLDSAASDRIPHIIDGIPLHLRDIRVYIDRPSFTLNPTSCEAASFTSTLGGSGVRFDDRSDDTTATTSDLFQVSNCSARGFKPQLGLRLRGPTKRAGYPSLRAVLVARPGDANIKRVSVSLPHTAFLAQNHIRDVCSRVQFEAGRCPESSVYGRAIAWTPLLDEPLSGPVYLRSSDNPLPDLVAELHQGAIRIVLGGRIDSVGEGRIRGIFDQLPDAPVTKFVLTMQGGRKGALVNSANLCTTPAYATARMVGQNNKGLVLRPRMRPNCGKGGNRPGRGKKKGAKRGEK
jgi:hypothetical protein